MIPCITTAVGLDYLFRVKSIFVFKLYKYLFSGGLDGQTQTSSENWFKEASCSLESASSQVISVISSAYKACDSILGGIYRLFLAGMN